MPHTEAVLGKLTFKMLFIDLAHMSPAKTSLTGNKFEIALVKDEILCTVDGHIDDMDPDIGLSITSVQICTSYIKCLMQNYTGRPGKAMDVYVFQCPGKCMGT